MSDTPATPDTPASTPESTPEAAAPVIKAPGFIRKSAVIFLLLLAIIGIGLFPFVVEPWILGQVRSQLAASGLELDKDSQLSVSILGGSIEGQQITLHETEGEPRVFTADSLIADLALWESITSGDVVISNLTLDNLTGTLRRTKSGRIPILEPPGTEPGKPTDWLGIAKQLMEWYKKYAPEQGEDTADPTKPAEPPPEPVPPAAEPATDWPKAVRYRPQPQPGSAWPRIIIRNLVINGKGLGLPDDTPFDVAAFNITGTNVALRLLPSETMNLDCKFETKGSGPLTLALNRAGGKEGSMQLAAKQVDLKALSDPAISGDALAAYGTTGQVDLDLSSTWTGWEQKGTVTSTLRDVKMQPSKDAGDNARQLAQAINAFEGKPVEWKPSLGGTLYAPVFTDLGLKSLQASAVEAGKQKVIDEGVKQLNQQLDKNPEVKDATDKAKDLFKGFGK